MHTKRIIPCLDVKQGRVVKGVKFVNIKDAGDPVEMAQLYSEKGADELVFLDITASSDKRNIMIDVVERVRMLSFIPFTVGGGLRNIEDIKAILRAGADKVSLSTSAVQKPDLLKESSKVFGSQCIVFAIDAKRKVKAGKYILTVAEFQQGWTQLNGQRKPKILVVGRYYSQAWMQMEQKMVMTYH